MNDKHTKDLRSQLRLLVREGILKVVGKEDGTNEDVYAVNVSPKKLEEIIQTIKRDGYWINPQKKQSRSRKR